MMNIESIIQAWKAEEEARDGWTSLMPALPVGEELTEQELEEVVGGFCGQHAFTGRQCADGQEW
ncbi:mersacidin/lichenicidin family type 2 lantibiotic [Ktedonosporobacter rubrisoli]|uniref:Mersacidin/lichenicidin family type 2 lantibiotic n=1 Tax=Ktedonosporobacter rubrisoli TaxID=2509675 RepID=A0A4P6JPM5_KTERU|nr:mersacidin/lichenicidin family type 2 lantibiotic [Ktedonosporobacter rubrisoli]QBD77339.1 mersacidin/lichenicidin family type 2 lantibiotic [Ktedonosporobacter rubrisoli]